MAKGQNRSGHCLAPAQDCRQVPARGGGLAAGSLRRASCAGRNHGAETAMAAPRVLKRWLFRSSGEDNPMSAGGIRDWYLDREARGGWSGDDDRTDRGPDQWLDRLTGSAPERGRRGRVSREPKPRETTKSSGQKRPSRVSSSATFKRQLKRALSNCATARPILSTSPPRTDAPMIKSVGVARYPNSQRGRPLELAHVPRIASWPRRWFACRHVRPEPSPMPR